MGALAADVNTSVVGVPLICKFAANAVDIFYRGSIVYIDTGGGAQVTAGAGDRALGFSPKKQSVAAVGDLVEVLVWGFVWVPLGTGVAAASEGELLVNDMNGAGGDNDNPADMESNGVITAAANDIAIGKIMKVEAARMLIYIDPAVTGNLYVATAGWGG